MYAFPVCFMHRCLFIVEPLPTCCDALQTFGLLSCLDVAVILCSYVHPLDMLVLPFAMDISHTRSRKLAASLLFRRQILPALLFSCPPKGETSTSSSLRRYYEMAGINCEKKVQASA